MVQLLTNPTIAALINYILGSLNEYIFNDAITQKLNGQKLFMQDAWTHIYS